MIPKEKLKEEEFKLLTPNGCYKFKDDILTDYKTAKKVFDKLTKDVNKGIITKDTIDWVQIIYSPIDEDEIVVYDFCLTNTQLRIKKALNSLC